MTSGSSFVDTLVAALDRTSEYARGSEEPPVAVLWPDQAKQWEPIVKQLAGIRPIVTLGAYQAASWTGPAYWIRCVVEGTVDRPLQHGTLVVYLPGYARSDVRAVEDAPGELRVLAELQFRGVVFSQLSHRDWTLLAFLQASEARGGLGLAVASDDATKAAILRARDVLGDVPIPELRRNVPLRAAFFDALLAPDIDRDVLRWLNDPAGFRAGLSTEQWEAFRSAFVDRFGMELAAGEVTVARELGRRDSDAWSQVWRAYADAPSKYPLVEERLRAAQPKKISDPGGLFDVRGSWPLENQEGESRLRAALAEVASADGESARERLIRLEQEHGERRQWVWASLGQAPLAAALQWLAVLGRETRRSVPESDLATIVGAYSDGGWRADDALLRALEAVESAEDAALVGEAAAAAYRPWLEACAERTTSAVTLDPGSYSVRALTTWPTGTCLLFTDGLRYDIALRVAALLERDGLTTDVAIQLAALPTITPTGKPAVSPAADRLSGGEKLGVRTQASSGELTAPALRKEIEAAGYQVLLASETGDPSGRAWTEQGDIDALGHEHQARLPALVDSEVRKLAVRIKALLAAGWERVVVVTDHGWLYLPGGLPKAELSVHLTKDGAMRKGRAARLAAGAETDVPVVPWHWDASVRIAVGPGIRVFTGTPVYDHGGISPQECVTAVISVRQSVAAARTALDVNVEWRGLRAVVTAAGAPSGATIDLRKQPGDPGSTISAAGARPLAEDGTASLLVEDEGLEDASATLVLLSEDGTVLAEIPVVVGGEG